MAQPRPSGPFRAGDRVQLTDAKGRHYTITLFEGGSYHTHRGAVAHDDLIGAPEASVVRSIAGTSYLAMRPLLTAWGVHGLATGGSGALLQAVVAAVLVFVMLDGARDPEPDPGPEPVAVLAAASALAAAMTRPGTVLVTDDLGRTRGVLDRDRAALVLRAQPAARLGEATTLLRPEQLVPQHADLAAVRDLLGPGPTIVVLGADANPVGVLL